MSDKDKDILNATLTSEALTEKYKDYEIKFVMHPLIFKNGNNILGAERGTGKTRMALAIAFSMIHNRKDFLGYRIDECGNVLYLNFEISEPEFKLMVEPIERFYSASSEKKFEFHSVSFKTYPSLLIKDIERAIKEIKPLLVVVDSFKAFSTMLLRELNQPELNNSNTKLIYDVFDGWRREHNTTQLITNHTNKGTKVSRSHSDLMYGPSAFMDYADHTTLMRKTNENNKRLLIPDKSRFAMEGTSTVNLVEIAGDEEKKQIWFNLMEEDVDERDYMYTESGGEKPSEAQKQQVIDLHMQGKSYREIQDETQIPKSSVARLVIKHIRETELAQTPPAVPYAAIVPSVPSVPTVPHLGIGTVGTVGQ